MKRKQATAPPRRPQSSRRARWRATLGELDWALDKKVQIEEAIEKLMRAERTNAAGLAALFSRARDADADVRRIIANAGPLDGASSDEIREWFSRSAEEWPDEYLEMTFRVYGERHKGRVLFIAESGHRAEFDPAKGWRPAEV
jgi:hypothetical protein